MSDKPEFNLGDTVFYAEASPYADEIVPCPVCFGKRSVVLILGNGEHQPVECEFCQRGWEGATGSVRSSRPASFVRESQIRGVRRDGDEWEYEVGYHERKKGSALFRTHAEAEAVRVVMHAEAERRAGEINDSRLASGKRRLTWLVGYHRRCLKEAQRTAAWHEKKLSEAKLAKAAERMDAKEAAR